MAWWTRKREAPKAITIGLSDPAVAGYFGVSPSAAGVPVTEGTVLGISAVMRAVEIVSGTIAGLPLRTLLDSNGKRKRVASWLDDPAGPDGQTRFEWTETIVAHLMLHGNAYLAHLVNGGGEIIGAIPVHPLAVREIPLQAGTGELSPTRKWAVSMADGTVREFTDRQMTHIPALSMDGTNGMSIIAYGRRSLGTTIAGDQAAANTFANGAMVAGIVTPEEDVDEDDAKKIKSSLDRKMTGLDNSGRLAFVNRRLKFTPWTMTAADAQFLESRQFQVEEVARWTGVPPHLLMQTEKQTSWGTGVTEQNRGLARYTLSRHTGRIESRLSRLMGPARFAEFDFAGLERPVAEVEIGLLIQQVQAGLMTVNEARAIRNMEPIEGGEVLRAGGTAPAEMEGTIR